MQGRNLAHACCLKPQIEFDGYLPPKLSHKCCWFQLSEWRYNCLGHARPKMQRDQIAIKRSFDSWTQGFDGDVLAI